MRPRESKILGMGDYISAVQLYAIAIICDAGSRVWPHPGLARDVEDGHPVRWYVSPPLDFSKNMLSERMRDDFVARIREAWEAVPQFSGVRVEVPLVLDGEPGLDVLRREAYRRLRGLSKTDELARDLLSVLDGMEDPSLFGPYVMTNAEKDEHAKSVARFRAKMAHEEADERARGIGLDDPPTPPHDDDKYRASLGIGPQGWNYGNAGRRE